MRDQVEEVVGAGEMKHHSEVPTARWSQGEASHGVKAREKEEPQH